MFVRTQIMVVQGISSNLQNDCTETNSRMTSGDTNTAIELDVR